MKDFKRSLWEILEFIKEFSEPTINGLEDVVKFYCIVKIVITKIAKEIKKIKSKRRSSK